MDIVVDYPPNIDEIRKVFPLTGQEIFAWGNQIYNPSGSKLPQWLIAHETVHKAQQGKDPQAWWDRYLIDPPWRFEQELEAHRVEYAHYCAAGFNRNRRRAMLKALARRLSSPMYGRIAPFKLCRLLIKNPA